jgi:hypothetical protein
VIDNYIRLHYAGSRYHHLEYSTQLGWAALEAEEGRRSRTEERLSVIELDGRMVSRKSGKI